MRDVNALTKNLLTELIAQLTLRNVKLPSAQFVAQGLPAWDSGEQFTASFMSLQLGHPGANAQFMYPLEIVVYGDFRVELVRAAPVPTSNSGAVSPSIQEAAAAATAADVEAMLDSFQAIITQATVVDPGVPFILTSVQVQGPEGGLVAVVGLASIALL